MRTRIISLALLCLTSVLCYSQKDGIKVACIGNSVTYGWGLQNREQASYPALLQQKLGQQYLVKNFGHSGATLLKRGHNPYFKTSAFQEMFQFKPDIAVIHLGLNDTDPRNFPNYRDDFIADYNWLIDTLKKINPKIEISICSLTPVFTGHERFLSSTSNWYWKLQQKIKEVAIINGLPLIDLNIALHNRPDVFTDETTLHPNEEGAEIIANTVYKHITGDFGGLQLPDLFTDNMVLQRNMPIRIWGKADAGLQVSVRFMNIKKTVKANVDGAWEVNFPPLEAVKIPQYIEIKDPFKNIILHNILIGDVWLCSGQSNMYFPLSQSMGSDSLLSNVNPLTPIRLFKYKPFAETDNRSWTNEELVKANQLNFFSGTWQLNNRNFAADFSAVAYSFGTALYKEINVPVGLIEVAVGGSPLISWVSRYSLESDPLFAPAFKNWRQLDYIMQWCRERADVNLKDATSVFQRHPYEPAFNFEAAIEKLIPYPIKGVIWYQGESDAENVELYERLFPLFVSDWRSKWKMDLPFYYVQLSSINRPSWNHFRDVQRRLLAQVNNCGMAVTCDLGDYSDVHYKDKMPVGQRLALLALNKTYAKNILASGPLFRSVERNNNQIKISFDYSLGLTTKNKEPLNGFEILTDKGIFIDVPANIKDRHVYITIPKDIKAKEIAYAWRPFTRANLVNRENLPASTFIEPIE